MYLYNEVTLSLAVCAAVMLYLMCTRTYLTYIRPPSRTPTPTSRHRDCVHSSYRTSQLDSARLHLYLSLYLLPGDGHPRGHTYLRCDIVVGHKKTPRLSDRCCCCCSCSAVLDQFDITSLRWSKLGIIDHILTNYPPGVLITPETSISHYWCFIYYGFGGSSNAGWAWFGCLADAQLYVITVSW